MNPADPHIATVSDAERAADVKPPSEPERTLRDLRVFYHSGRPPAWARSVDDLDLIPVLMQPYRDPSRLRLPYPVCRTEGGLRILTELLDDVAQRIPLEGDDRERRLRDLHRLEPLLRAASSDGAILSTAWTAAAKELAQAAEDEELAIRLEELWRLVEVDGPLLDCSPDTVIEMFELSARHYAERRTSSIREYSASLRRKLDDVLQAERRTQIPADDDYAGIDPARFKDLIEHAHLDNLLPAERRKRIRATVEELAELERSCAELFRPARAGTPDEIGAHLTAARTRLTDVVRLLRTAELEAVGKYHAGEHEAYFESFTWRDVSSTDLEALPHPVVIIDARTSDPALQSQLPELLDADLPVKLLISLPDPVGGSMRIRGWSRLAGRAALSSMGFVAQTAASDPQRILEDTLTALEAATPALVSVYAAAFDSTVSSYLATAAARDGRVVPSFRFDAAAGTDWASRFDVEENPQAESPWPFDLTNLETDNDREYIVFTAADFLAVDARFRDEFVVLPADVDQAAIVPLLEWLAIDDPTEARIPYILMARPDGAVSSVALTRAAAGFTASAAEWWRTLQELGGINNSHARRLVAAERARLKQQMETDLDVVRRTFEEKLDRATSDVARDIVTNIASGLLSLPASNGRTAVSPGPVAAPAEPKPIEEDAPAAGAPEAGEEEPEPEEELSFDDPYIDTPLCTTCNECTNLNGQIFAYNDDKQAYIADPDGGHFRDLVKAAELCPVHIIHPGKPRNPDEGGLEALVERARPFN